MNFQSRDLRAVLVLAGAVVVFLILWKVVLGGGGDSGSGAAAVTDLKRVEKMRDDFRVKLGELQAVAAGIDEIDRRIKSTPPNQDLFQLLSKMIDDLGLKDAISSMSPNKGDNTEYFSEFYIDVEISQITADKLVALLEKIEASEVFLKVSQLSIKRWYKKDDDVKAVKVTMRVSMYGPPTAAGATAP